MYLAIPHTLPVCEFNKRRLCNNVKSHFRCIYIANPNAMYTYIHTYTLQLPTMNEDDILHGMYDVYSAYTVPMVS